MSVEKAEGRRPKEKKGENTVVLDIDKIAKGNLALKVVDGGIVNGASFKPEWYDTQRAEVVRVDDEHGGFYHRIRDGHHRLSGAIGYRLTHPDYLVFGNDVTDFLTTDKYPGQKHLTSRQALIEASDPNRIHAEHRFRRVASLMISEWDRILGDDADTFSGLAGIKILGKPSLQMSTLNPGIIDEAIDKQHKSEEHFFGGETKEQKKVIAEGLHELASSIVSTQFGYPQIAYAANELITGHYEDIGEEERKRQLQGLVRIPEVYASISFGSGGINKKREDEVLGVLGNLYKKYPSKDELTTVMRRVHIGLSRNYMDYDELLGQLRGDPIRRASGSYLTRSQQNTHRGTGSVGTLSSTVEHHINRKPRADSEQVPTTRDVNEVEVRKSERVIVNANQLIAGLLTPRLAPPSSQEVHVLTTLAAMIQKHINKGAPETQTHSGNSPTIADRPDDYSKGQWSKQIKKYISGKPSTITFVEKLYQATQEEKVKGSKVPAFVLSHPEEVFISRWGPHTACLDTPDALNVAGTLQNEAKKICGGCPVKHSCLAMELTQGPGKQSYARGGMTDRERRDLLKNQPEKAQEIIDGVKEAVKFHDRLAQKFGN